MEHKEMAAARRSHGGEDWGLGAMEGWTQSAEINLDEVSIITSWMDLYIGGFRFWKLNSHHIGIGVLSTNKLFLPTSFINCSSGLPKGSFKSFG